MADMARLMLRDCNSDLQEILECWLCYKHSNDKTLRNWFIKPCKPPHELVYARQKGYPYWPAKVIKENEDSYDVRFFGGVHERAIVEKLYIRPISVNIHTLQVKRTSSWNRACEELKRYQKQLDKLREETDNFTKPFVDSSSDESDVEEVPKSLSPSTSNVATAVVVAAVDEDDDVKEDDDDDDEEEEDVASGASTSKRIKDRSGTQSHVAPNSDEKIDVDKKNSASDNQQRAKSDAALKTHKHKSAKNKTTSLKITVNAICKTSTKKAENVERKVIRGRGRPKKITAPSTSVINPLATVAVTGLVAATAASDCDTLPEEAKGDKVTPALAKISTVKRQKTRGRPPKAATQAKKARMWSSDSLIDDANNSLSSIASAAGAVSAFDASESKKCKANAADVSIVKFESEVEDHNISSTSAAAKCHTSPKGNEEEIVSSSSSQNPTKRSVKTQTKQLDMKPSKEWIEKIEEEFEQEKERVIAKLNKEHEQEVALIRQAHSAILSETKRKQWCVNCESEAIYHCCWNTSYCSPDCQLAHWAADHKRHCRRKR